MSVDLRVIINRKEYSPDWACYLFDAKLLMCCSSAMDRCGQGSGVDHQRWITSGVRAWAAPSTNLPTLDNWCSRTFAITFKCAYQECWVVKLNLAVFRCWECCMSYSVDQISVKVVQPIQVDVVFYLVACGDGWVRVLRRVNLAGMRFSSMGLGNVNSQENLIHN